MHLMRYRDMVTGLHLQRRLSCSRWQREFGLTPMHIQSASMSANSQGVLYAICIWNLVFAKALKWWSGVSFNMRCIAMTLTVRCFQIYHGNRGQAVYYKALYFLEPRILRLRLMILYAPKPPMAPMATRKQTMPMNQKNVSWSSCPGTCTFMPQRPTTPSVRHK